MSPKLAALLAAFGVATAQLVWPMPQTFNTGSGQSILGMNFTISGSMFAPLPAAYARYESMIFFAGAGLNASAGQPGVITGLIVTVVQNVSLTLGVNETYVLNVPVQGNATLWAPNQWGALRGLESFSQLVIWNMYTDGEYEVNIYNVSGTPIEIIDYPRFPWRGVLIDSSRHFLTVSAIMSTLDAMSYLKLNRLHWHWVDDNSWPVYSVTYPNFTMAAYAPQAIYYHADLINIQQYAWERGITIVPEFDGPAHASAWGVGYPELVISCADGQTLLNPTEAGGLYTTIEGLLQEFVPLLQTDFVHFGGDEVETLQCWQESSEVQAFMTQYNLSDVNAVRNYFEVRVQQIAASMSLRTAFWEEVYDDGYTLLPNTVVDVWLSGDELISVVNSNQPAILSYGFYLDQQLPPGDDHYFWQDTWQNFWLNDPLYNATNVKNPQLVLGYSHSMWGEQVDASNINSRMFPRGCAGAERFWSDMNLRDVTAAEGRLENMRCHLLQRGIGAGPIRPSDEYGYCALPEVSRFNHMHVKWT